MCESISRSSMLFYRSIIQLDSILCCLNSFSFIGSPEISWCQPSALLLFFKVMNHLQGASFLTEAQPLKVLIFLYFIMSLSNKFSVPNPCPERGTENCISALPPESIGGLCTTGSKRGSYTGGQLPICFLLSQELPQYCVFTPAAAEPPVVAEDSILQFIQLQDQIHHTCTFTRRDTRIALFSKL